MNQISESVRKLLLLVAALGCLALAGAGPGPSQTPAAQHAKGKASSNSADGYVGSKECQLCHAAIYRTFSQTDMGRSVKEIDSVALAKLPTPFSLFDQRLNRHFEVSVRDGHLFQSEYERAPDGSEVFRDTREIQWLLGAGANGIGGIVRQGNHLFEAPLSYYADIQGWGLSPGYQYGDYGFSRPILPGCVTCHSGRPQPVPDGNGRFLEPPFQQVAVGCENCHGPGAEHISRMKRGLFRNPGIVNPQKLAPWLADNICMGCHQTGDARVLETGKQYRDFRPWQPLNNTLHIFLVPFDQQHSPPQDDLLEHYLSMRLSKCYRGSAGKMRCITCHDPHVQPASEEAPAYFRQKCLTCHSGESCTALATARQETAPPDNCISCHMPKRNVKVISHSALTNHRIVARPDEPFPAEAFQMTTPELPDLVQLSALPGTKGTPSPLVLLRAYRQVMLSHPEYRSRYWSLAQKLQVQFPNNVSVLQALADLSLQKRNLEGATEAIHHLKRAVAHGSTVASDFEELGKLLIATRRLPEAVSVLEQGTKTIPYDLELYRMLGKTYIALKQSREACHVWTRALGIFPQDSEIRHLAKSCSASSPAALPH